MNPIKIAERIFLFGFIVSGLGFCTYACHEETKNRREMYPHTGKIAIYSKLNERVRIIECDGGRMCTIRFLDGAEIKV